MAKKKLKKNQKEAIKKLAIALVVLLISIIGAFKLGLVGRFFYSLVRVMFGQYPELFFALLLALTFAFTFYEKTVKKEPPRVWVSLIMFVIVYLLSLAMPKNPATVGFEVLKDYQSYVSVIFVNYNQYAYGGYVGAFLYSFSSLLIAKEGTIILNIILSILATVLLLTPHGLLEILKKIWNGIKRFFLFIRKLILPAKKVEYVEHEEEIIEDIIIPEPIDTNEKVSQQTAQFMRVDTEADITENIPTKIEGDQLKLDLTQENPTRANTLNIDNTYSNYQLPPIQMLEGVKRVNKSSVNSSSAKEKGNRIIEVMKQFGIEAELLNIHIGPSVTKFEIKPDSNVKISKISSIQDNMMMELAVTSLRIEAPIPGRAAVGIEIPNIEMMPVRLKEILGQSKNIYEKDNIWVALGKNLLGEPIMIALNKMPHLLIAGATGSGKSVCINSLISSIVLTKHPKDLKLLLIDPKKVEFTPYTKLPHLMSEVVTDPKEASAALKKVVEEMEVRYETFANYGVRNIGSYNKMAQDEPDRNIKHMPWIVVIIDELADLMAVAGKEVETSIQRITQLARAAGIHLVVATQRPSVDVVTGIIKANIPSRIAFAVSSAVDSRTILDTTGAEKLLGYGDMLYIPMGAPSPIRVQGVYVSDEEVNAITKYASDQAKPEIHEGFSDLHYIAEEDKLDPREINDEYFEDAIEFVTTNGRASTSLIQRQFRIGYNRAANIMDALEERGIIGPPNGSKPREVLYQDYEMYLDYMKNEQ